MLLSDSLIWSDEEILLIPEIDRAFAEVTLNEPSSNQALFLAFLAGSARSGFLYVDLDRLPIEEVWEGATTLAERILEGGRSLPKLPSKIVQHKNKFYLQRLFTAECTCLEEWKRIASTPPRIALHETALAAELEGLELNAEQKAAVEMGCQTSLFVLTGGPGTGKTFTAGRLLRSLHRASSAPLEIVIAAPTGKAALTLETALHKFIGQECVLQSKTLHSLLGIKGNARSLNPDILPYDVILVDEASMIDVELMSLLLSSIKSGARLIFLGDPYQLPPVEGAPIFPALVQIHGHKVELKKCLRAESLGLIEAADSILKTGKFETNVDVKLLDMGSELKSVIQAHAHLFSSGSDNIESFQNFRILTPLRRGPAGSDAINRLIFQTLPKEGMGYIPVMITVNDHRFGLFNGEIGLLKTAKKEFPFNFDETDWVYFPKKPKFPALLLPRFELAYAMTVHKSQGSEFQNLLLLLPKAGKPPSRALLYTAFTRARKSITIWQEFS